MATDTAQNNGRIQELLGKCQELQDHLNIIQELVVSLDPQGNIRSINRNGCKILGYARDGLVGQNWFDKVIPDSDRQRLKTVFAEMLTGRHEQTSQLEYDVVTADGNLRRIELHNTLVQDSNGHITGALSSGIDVTEARLQKRRLAWLQTRLTQTAGIGTLGEIATGLAHEINQPLSAISTYSDACLRLLDKDDPELARLKHALQKISQQAHRAGDVIARMRSLAQPPTPGRALVDCNTLIQDLIGIIRADEYHTQVSTTLDLEEALEEVSVDPVQIQQVVLNYVRNAIDALEATAVADRKVSIETRRDGNTIRCSVIDNGNGVAQDAVTELFDPFFTTKEGRIGMGLSICKTIVEHHGGQVDYQPNPVRGATFSFTLPIPATYPSSPTRQ
jgi:PAS domain S-box-containing protein